MRFISTKKAPPCVFRNVLERSGWHRAPAGIRHQDVDRPESPFDPVPHGLDLLEAGQVGGGGQRAATGRLDLPHDRGHCDVVTSVHRHGGALLCEVRGDGSPDATGAPRHEGDSTQHRIYVTLSVASLSR